MNDQLNLEFEGGDWAEVEEDEHFNSFFRYEFDQHFRIRRHDPT